MARNRTHIAASPEAVWETLGNPFAYPRWVVGADRTLSADDNWPQPGASFEVRLAGGVRDVTRALELDRGKRLVIEAGSWTGPARVTIETSPAAGGTALTMIEDPAGKMAPLRFLPPVQLLLRLRNRESLRRLRRIVEGS